MTKIQSKSLFGVYNVCFVFLASGFGVTLNETVVNSKGKEA